MNTSISLQPKFHNSFVLIGLIGIFLLITAIITIYKFLIKNLKSKSASKVKITEKDDSSRNNPIKDKYIEKLNAIAKQIENGTCDDRKAHQRLSSLFRQFVFDYSNVDVTTKTLEELRETKNPNIISVIEYLYYPEFDIENTNKAKDAIKKTGKAIKDWK